MPLTVSQTKTSHRAGSTQPQMRHFVQGELPLPQFTTAGASGAVTWSDGGAGGVFSGAPTDATRIYTPANKTQIVNFTFSDGITTVNKTLLVWGTLPIYPQKGFKVGFDQETKELKAQDGTAYQRASEKPMVAWQLNFERREKDELLEFVRFWLAHKKTLEFYIADEEINLLAKVKFVIGTEPEFVSGNSWSWSAVVKGFYNESAVFDANCPHI